LAFRRKVQGTSPLHRIGLALTWKARSLTRPAFHSKANSLRSISSSSTNPSPTRKSSTRRLLASHTDPRQHGSSQLLQDVQRPAPSFRVRSSVRILNPRPLSASLLRPCLGHRLIVGQGQRAQARRRVWSPQQARGVARAVDPLQDPSCCPVSISCAIAHAARQLLTCLVRS
jgi:hypothetical protein